MHGQGPNRVRLWWWGEDEAPGVASWVARAALAHERRANVQVECRLLAHDEVIGSLARAGDGATPDVHFLWNGLYHIQDAWAGLLTPLEDVIDAGSLTAIAGGPQSQDAGKTYRAAWYVIPVVMIANRDALERAGIGGLPTLWEEFAATCENLMMAGIAPIVCGDGEGDFSVWWLTHLLTQALDRGADVAELVLGERSWREAPNVTAWQQLARFVHNGWVDAASLRLTLWDAFAEFCRGRGAFTLASGPMLVAARRHLAMDVCVLTAPRIADARLASRPIVDTQGFGIPARATDPLAGGALLETLLAIDQCDELYARTGLLPARVDWEPPHPIGEANAKQMWQWHRSGATAPYVPNLVPPAIHYGVCAGLGTRVIAGAIAPDAAAREADAICAKWRRDEPALAERYRTWIATVREHESP